MGDLPWWIVVVVGITWEKESERRRRKVVESWLWWCWRCVADEIEATLLERKLGVDVRVSAKVALAYETTGAAPILGEAAIT